MRIGFCGAHRTGKSTLAKAVAEHYHLPHLGSPSTGVAAEFGFDMNTDSRVSNNGIAMQAEILNRFKTIIGDQRAYVMDRTPLDVAVYALADGIPGAGDAETQERTLILVEDALRATSKMFDIVILVQPGIPVVATETSPAPNTLYQEHFNALCRGLLFDTDANVYWDELRRDTLDHDSRLKFVCSTITNWAIAVEEAEAA